MRALKIAVIAMGVLIVGGTVTLVVLIIQRATREGSASNASSAAPVVPGSVAAAGLGEPDGTRIAGIATVGDRIAVQLQGGGADRLVLLDARSLKVVGRVTLGR